MRSKVNRSDARFLLAGSCSLALVVVFLLICPGSALSYENRALILVDEPSIPSVNGSSQAILENLMGHFSLGYDVKSVDDYTTGDVDRYRVTFYLGTVWDKQLPAAFLKDVISSRSRIVWIGYNLWKVGWDDSQPAFEDRFGIRFNEVLDTGVYDRVSFQGRTFSRSADSYSYISILDGSKAATLANLTTGSQNRPYAIRSGDFFFVADDPLGQPAEDSPYLVFCELLHDMTGINHPVNHRALVRIEDIDATEDPARIRAIADYLHSEGVPFSLAVIPRFSDPLGAWGPPMTLDLKDSPELVSALQYAVSKGGTVIMHGFTHQYGSIANPTSGVSGVDSEFFIQSLDVYGNVVDVGPVPEDSPEWVQTRIDSGVDTLAAAGFARPLIWETPHYLASELDYQVFSSNFDMLYQRFAYAYFPYVLEDNVYGSKLIPENLGYISPGVTGPQVLKGRADKNLVIRDGFASFFFHSELDISYLKNTVAGIKAKGYTFVDVNSLAADAPFDAVAPVVTYSGPQGWIRPEGATVLTATYTDPEPSQGIDPATAAMSINSAALSCVAMGGEISCTTTGLPEGHYDVAVSISDNYDNEGLAAGSFDVDLTPPVIGNIAPAGTVAGASAIVEADLSDPGSGVDAAGATVTLDGAPLSCQFAEGHLSCPVSGLKTGAHAISIYSVDNVGNSVTVASTFSSELCTGEKPSLGIAVNASYWDSYADYQARTLTVDYHLTNVGGPDAMGVTVVGATCTNGVVMTAPPPTPVDVPGGGIATIGIQYHVPAGVSSFRTTTYVTARDVCGNIFAYPGPYAGS